jgi:hypothetical protein
VLAFKLRRVRSCAATVAKEPFTGEQLC